jgi:Phytoene dehydrogenase and related proteins
MFYWRKQAFSTRQEHQKASIRSGAILTFRNGSTFDMTERMEEQIERVAPGFRKIVLQRSILPPMAMQEKNANHIGGDINGGALNLGQMFTRPNIRAIPYSTPIPGLYLCSSSTPPGGGVHGMPGWYAAQCALHNWR